MLATDEIIRSCVARSNNREELWINFLDSTGARHVAEVGVHRGQFASSLLRASPSIDKYYMIDPWRHLDDWNKPANLDDDYHEKCLLETKSTTEFAADKVSILRGRTTEVSGEIPDGSLDLAYIDGDHTLRGITIDLIRLLPKVREGGWIGGDDFHASIWQHSTKFEPTLVFPFSVYFAEAIGARIYALPYHQFLMEKSAAEGYSFVDLSGQFAETGLRHQFHPNRFARQALAEALPSARRAAKTVKRMFVK